MSKLLLNKYTNLLALRKEIIDNNIQTYSIHPGWVKTDMGT